jgi:hypothetical protein
MIIFRMLWRRVVSSLLLLCVLGCAMSDYEARIDAQRKRLDTYDEENRLLGDAIEPPVHKGKKGHPVDSWPFSVYLRLPREVLGDFHEKNQYQFQDLPLFRYSGREGVNVFVAAGLISGKKDDKSKEGKAKEGKARPTEWSVDTFRDYVRGALIEFYRKEHKGAVDFPTFDRGRFQKMEKQPISELGTPLPAISFDAMAFTDDTNRFVKEHSLFQAYFYQSGNQQLAIIFQSPLASKSDENLIKTVDWSLKSLEIGPNAVTKRYTLLNRKQRKA